MGDLHPLLTIRQLRGWQFYALSVECEMLVVLIRLLRRICALITEIPAMLTASVDTGPHHGYRDQTGERTVPLPETQFNYT